MDHLPKIKLFEGAFVKVPYLSDRGYDGGLFEKYPKRRGWDLKRLLSQDFSEHPPADTSSFLQTWLFFGTLHEILEHAGGRSNSCFVTEDEEGKKWISTSELDLYIRQWAEHLNSVGDHDKLVVSINKLKTCLQLLKAVIDVLYGSEARPIPDEVVVSIKVLGSTIEAAFAWYFNIRKPVSWGLKDISASRMFSEGWCPRDVALTSHYLSDIAMLYASYIKRDYQKQDHSECTETTCEVNQIDERSYNTQHTTEECQCNHVEPDQEEIQKILRKGQVPLVSLTSNVAPDGSKTLDIGIKSHKYLRWFVAISHVWSDGLGNSKRNSLPMCQLQALYDLVVDRYWDELFATLDGPFQELGLDPEFYSEKWKGRIDRFGKKVIPALAKVSNTVRDRRGRPISIWIDTLCVPLEKTHRKMAIAGLKSVYSGAMYTVVLDSELQRISCACSAEENLMRIAISGWMRRAWTFQEGVLSNSGLRVKFADGLVDLRELLGEEDNSLTLDWYLVQNATMTKGIQKMKRTTEKHFGEHTRQEVARKEAKRKENYSMSAYISDEAKSFFSYMIKVWSISYQTDPRQEAAREDRTHRIIAAWQGLVWRSTSRKEDKIIIFATFCIYRPADLDAVQGLLNFPSHGRMKLWLSQQFALPAGFLFLPGKRYKEEGWGWAPLDVAAAEIDDKTCVTRNAGDTYLEVTKRGWIFSVEESLKDSTFIFTNVANQKLRVKLDQPYLESIEERPPLPQRPSEKPPPLPPRPNLSTYSSMSSRSSLGSQATFPLPPRPGLPSIHSSNTWESLRSQTNLQSPPFYNQFSSGQSSFTSQASIPLPSRPQPNSSEFKSSVEPKPGVKTPNRRIPSDNVPFGLILADGQMLGSLTANDTVSFGGAIITITSRDEKIIKGLFVCSVMIEQVTYENEEMVKVPEVKLLDTFGKDDNQVWRVG